MTERWLGDRDSKVLMKITGDAEIVAEENAAGGSDGAGEDDEGGDSGVVDRVVFGGFMINCFHEL